MKVYECNINLFWIYTPFYSTCRPHEFRKAVKQAERDFWQVIYRSRHRSIWKALKYSNLHSSWPVSSCTWYTQSDILVQVALLLWSLLSKTQNLNWQLSTSYSELLVISHLKNMGWKGIFGILDLNKIRCVIQEKHKISWRGNGIWLLPRKRDSPKFRARDVGFFYLSVGDGKSWRLNTRSPRQMRFNKASVQLCLLSTEQNIHSDLVNDCLTEMFK